MICKISHTLSMIVLGTRNFLVHTIYSGGKRKQHIIIIDYHRITSPNIPVK